MYCKFQVEETTKVDSILLCNQIFGKLFIAHINRAVSDCQSQSALIEELITQNCPGDGRCADLTIVSIILFLIKEQIILCAHHLQAFALSSILVEMANQTKNNGRPA